jgi:hypothetical protein
MNIRKISLLLIAIIVFPLVVQAQSLEETVAKLSTVAAQKYVEPAITAFGSNLNSGWINQVPQAKTLDFDLNIKIVGMGTFLNDKAKTFSTAGMFRFTSSQADNILANSGITSSHPAYASAKQELLSKEWSVNFSGPTIIGKENDHLKIVFPGGTVSGVTLNQYTETVDEVKGLLDELPILPMACPQVTIGTVMGTSVSVRYFPSVELDKKLGKLTFGGFGIIHNPAVWLDNPLPVDFGIGYFYQKLKIGDILESDATQYGVFVSKTIGTTIALTPYAGFVIEDSKTTIKYDYEYNAVVNGAVVNVKDKINFELKGENSSAFLVGATIKLAVLNLNVDYKMAKYKTLSAGVSFGF